MNIDNAETVKPVFKIESTLSNFNVDTIASA